jgi:hypothetical protein
LFLTVSCCSVEFLQEIRNLFELIWFPKEKVMNQIRKQKKREGENQIKIEKATETISAQLYWQPMAHPD